MNKSKLLYGLLIIVLLLQFSFCQAEIKLPAIISSNMVLQRNEEVTLWGWADPNERIRFKFSWIKKEKTVVVDDDGNWKLKIQTTDVRDPQRITISSKKQRIVLDNILFGEVWLCSGQSNMFEPLEGYTGQPVKGALEAIVQSKNENIRLFSVQTNASKIPLTDVKNYKGWDYARPETVVDYSAVAYFFGKQLQEVLDVPVGIIHSSWGGSHIQAWMAAKTIGKFQKINLDTVNLKYKTNQIPSVLYNAMISPLIPYSIKGILWYQGESNRSEPALYRKMFPAMVKDWRDKWGKGNFPFYYVQIAPYHYKAKNAFGNTDNTAFLREAQFQCMNEIPEAGMAVTMDIGEEGTIHPQYKKQVANRLLYLALNRAYGYHSIDCSGPVYDSFEIKDGGVYIRFKEAENGLVAPDVFVIDGFTIAGSDHVFYPAKARLYKRKLVFVHGNRVPNPVAVRYCWSNWVRRTLFDTNGLPASSFRTDNWNYSTKVTDKE